MIVRRLWRFPVKSVGGERLDEVEVSELHRIRQNCPSFIRCHPRRDWRPIGRLNDKHVQLNVFSGDANRIARRQWR